MNKSNIMKVGKCNNIYSTIYFLLQFSAFVRAGIFTPRNIYIPSFKYQLCDHNLYNKRWGFSLRDLDIMATSYGDVDFTGSFVTITNLTSPLKATVNLKRKVLGINIKIPCIKNLGSCTYNDLCEYGYPKDKECPPILEEYDIPCRCPIESGTYNIPGVQFKEMAKSRWAGLLAGKYKATVKLYQDKELLACYIVHFTLSKPDINLRSSYENLI